MAVAIAAAAWWAGGRLPIIGAAVFALVLGVAAGQFFRPARAAAGLAFAGKKVLQYAIVLLGFEMEISRVLIVGSKSLAVLLCTTIAAFGTMAALWRLLRVPEDQAILIGVGTCICGGSAIAATAPVIGAKERDIAQAISTIFLFNIIAVFLFPAAGRLLGMSDEGFGLWAGTAINDTSSVVAAASAWSDAAGNQTALALATIVKLTRTLLIIPVTLVLAAARTARARRKGGDAAADAPAAAGGKVDFARIFPWFVLAFLAAALARSFIPLSPALPRALVACGKFLIVVAMAAIGARTNLRELISGGWRPILLGLCCWFAVAAVSLGVQRLSSLL
ncbi:putative sulfate exporter family transporter [bacterium]|nr:putative sulfate exporter family transporter [bacterium]